MDILKRYGWGIDKVTKHQDYTNKYCPHRTLDMGWDRFIKMVENELNDSNKISNDVNVFYRVKTQKHGWLSEVKNLDDYAGWENSPITDVAIKVDKGSVRYRVHIKGGKWLPYVTGYNINDFNNGYAGTGKIIDAIEVYYNTPSDIVKNSGYKKAKYKVNNYSWQLDNENNSGMDGYAGLYGNFITKFQIVIE